MNDNLYKEITDKLSKDFFLLKKWGVYSLLGGFIGALVAAGIFSYKAFENATNDNVILEKQRKAEKSANEILKIEEVLKKKYQDINTTLRSLEAVIPIGSIIPYAGDSSTIPSNWMLCDGKQINRKEYDKLFEVIQVYWGNGDRVNTFNLPDLRGQFLRGVSYGSKMDPDEKNRFDKSSNTKVGDIVGSYQSDATKKPNINFTTDEQGNHSHRLTTGGSASIYASDANYDRRYATLNATNKGHHAITEAMTNDGNHKHTIILGGDNETRPKNAYVTFIIKVQ